MMLFPQDMKDGLQALLYNVGFAKSPPKMGRYTFEEKFEYWAFVWGYTVMAISGFLMWNPVISFKILPGELFPAARAAHGGEAVLAVLAILVWHMYHVRIKRVNNAMFTGSTFGRGDGGRPSARVGRDQSGSRRPQARCGNSEKTPEGVLPARGILHPHHALRRVQICDDRAYRSGCRSPHLRSVKYCAIEKKTAS